MKESKELKRPRLDTGRNIFSQMTSVFDDVSTASVVKSDGPVESINSDGDTTIIHMPGKATGIFYTIEC